MNKLLDLWRFAEVAYDYPSGHETLFADALEFVRLDFRHDFGFIARYKSRIIISFRGTKDFRTKAGYEAWCMNLDTYPLYRRNDERIHKGFYEAWQPFKAEINDYIKVLQKLKFLTLPAIEVTGHSRGSCDGTLCCRYIAKNLKIPCSGIVFGTPRVGNKFFRNEFNMLPINFTRVNNGYDIVQYVPPRSLNFRHVGKHYWLKQPFWHKWVRKVHDHKPENYKVALLKLNKKRA